MAQLLGIRLEDKHQWEARAPFAPEQLAALAAQHGIQALVQASPQRAFPDEDYRAAGALVSADVGAAPVLFGVKEMPAQTFRPGGVYVFFSHTIKGQPHNMPMLAALMAARATLIDYELVTDEQGRRLIFFGRYAGLAGMVDTLWALGQRLLLEGHEDNPFAHLRQAKDYADLGSAKDAVHAAAIILRKRGLPRGLLPLVVGFSGYGHVSSGAQEVFDLLPHKVVSPAELPALLRRGRPPAKQLYKVVFREEHLVERADGGPFELQEYYQHPERYRGVFAERALPHLSVLVNGIFWTERYPRLATHEDLAQRAGRLKVVGDISCDVDGSLQCTVRSTTPGEPTFVYDPATRNVTAGLAGPGIVVMAVDTLPCELPVEASRDFGAVLTRFAPAVLAADYSVPFAQLSLPPEIKRAVIVYNGQLTERFRYLEPHLARHGAAAGG